MVCFTSSISVFVVELQFDQIAHTDLIGVVNDEFVVLKASRSFAFFATARGHDRTVFQVEEFLLVRNRSSFAPSAVLS